jgi:hypothetical protein
VNISKLSSQIRREMVGDPKKAVILAGLLLLAGYYWAPLVWGWVSKGDTNQQEIQLAALAASSAPAQVAPVESNVPSVVKNTHAPLHRWQTLVKWMDADPRTKPLKRVGGRRDPFTDRRITRRIADGSALADDRPVTPENLGMRLTGIMIGAQRRVALIDGRAYVLGEEIPVELAATTKNQETPSDTKLDDDDTRPASKGDVNQPQFIFTLVEVRRRSVVLSRKEKSYPLKLPSPEPSNGGFVISFAKRKLPSSGP